MDWMKVPHVQRLPPTAANLTAAETGTDLDTEGKIDFGFRLSSFSNFLFKYQNLLRKILSRSLSISFWM